MAGAAVAPVMTPPATPPQAPPAPSATPPPAAPPPVPRVDPKATQSVPLAEVEKLRARARDAEARNIEYERMAARTAAPAPAGPTLPADFDPFDPKSFTHAVRTVANDLVAERIRPLQEENARLLWDRQIEQAKARLGNRFNWDRDREAIAAKVTDLPGVSVTEAMILVEADRANGTENSPASTGADSLATRTPGAAAAGALTSAQDTASLDTDERYVASRLGMSVEEYLKYKQEGDADRAAGRPTTFNMM